MRGVADRMLKDRHRLSAEGRADLDALSASAPPNIASARLYCEQLHAILDRKQIDVVSAMPKQRCTNVRRRRLPA